MIHILKSDPFLFKSDLITRIVFIYKMYFNGNVFLSFQVMFLATIMQHIFNIIIFYQSHFLDKVDGVKDDFLLFLSTLKRNLALKH